ncbi:penicillin-binding protein [Colletotrichum cereale]|nr:penicillin-binding protein [Colletotrichum cereale]
MHLQSLLILLSLCVLIPTSFAAPKAQPDVEAYFNVDGSTHATKSETLQNSGYRIISLSAYGTPRHNYYAAVWVKREGNNQQTISGANAKTFEKWVDSWTSKGYAMMHIATTTGPSYRASFAGVMEKKDVGKWKHKCDLKQPDDFHTEEENSHVVKGYSTYGTFLERRYCVLVHENIGNAVETIFYNLEYPKKFDYIYEAEIKKTFWRPAHLFYGNNKRLITPHFASDWVGKWEAMTDLTADQLETAIHFHQRQGLLYPIHISGTGSGKKARFAAIFAETDVPEPRKWTVTGKEDDAGMSKRVDSIMQAWMRKNGVRQAQVAAAEKGEIIFERGYTWAESNRAIVQPDDVFLMASLSKMFAHAAIYNLFQAGKLEPSTRVFDLLGYKKAKDPRIFDTTVNHLLTHRTGFDRDKSGDVAFQFRQVSKYFYNNKRTPSLRDMIEYQLTRPLDFEPGAKFAYSNYGTMLLGYVVSNITEQPYFEFLKENILKGADVRVYETAAEKHIHDRIIQETLFAGPDSMHPESLKMVPDIFGGDGVIKEECDASFTLAASASTIAKFIGHNAVWGIGGRKVNRRNGSMEGAHAFAESTPSGIDWVITINTRDFVNLSEAYVLRNRISALLATP